MDRCVQEGKVHGFFGASDGRRLGGNPRPEEEKRQEDALYGYEGPPLLPGEIGHRVPITPQCEEANYRQKSNYGEDGRLGTGNGPCEAHDPKGVGPQHKSQGFDYAIAAVGQCAEKEKGERER